ncbi:hypothetical protein [Natronobacterium texcoconense]|uniref:Uncharacterized protein n=1 Tax=Natronobacterium texcoconense TaxID=1095778 RepID=A0A1H1ECR3_NATTX|nr:hypothetical protein [Natronobacterium texcoconense]SDQ86209.1 hypothetical protein SAMN04489842_1528 [Natronobacterium texcoconense]
MVLHFREATSVYRKTLPYALLQLGIGVIFAVLGVIYLSLIGWLAVRFFWGDGGLSLVIVGGVMLLGLASFAFIWRLIQKYFLYMVKTGHVAVIAHVVEEGEVPENQISYGMKQVGEYFVSASGLFTVSVIVDAVLEQFNRAVARVQSVLPFPVPQNLQTLISLVQKSIRLAVKYLDNAIIAYMFVDRNENRWQSARDGLVLYGKTWKMVLGSTLLIVFGMYALSFVLLTLLAPLAVALDFLPTSLELVSWLFVGGMVAVVHTGVVKPWVKTVVITTFLIEQRDEEPDSETMEWISEHSDRFDELREKAENNEPLAEDAPETGGPTDAPADSGSDLADD